MRSTLALCIATATTVAEAQGSLVGSVRVKDGGAPLTIAEVEIPALGLKTRVDSTGKYSFPALPVGRYLVVARAIGYGPRGDSVAVGAIPESRRHFELPVAATQLDAALIIASSRYISPLLRAFEERQRTGFGRYMGEEELRKHDDRSFATTIRKFPGWTIVQRGGKPFMMSARRSSSGRGALSVSAQPSCGVSIYLDGVMMYDQQLSFGKQPSLDEFNIRDLAGVEYYPGEASTPVQFRPSVCGTLLLWTRER